MSARTGVARAVAELIAVVGVIVSLVFVGLELRQNTAAVRGATFQALSDASAADLSAIAHNPPMAALLQRVYFEDVGAGDFSDSDNMQLYFYYMAFARRLENSYLQFESGIVDDRIFESYGWRDAILTRPHFREFWDHRGGGAGVSPEFRRFFESRILSDGS
jgi:hypothetical protein